jgi:hypothetical protein
MDELINDLDKVLTDECQPLSGFKTQTIPGQPRRLSPKTPGGVGTGISVKFWLIAPTHPQDIASIAGILLPTPILFPLKIAEDTASPLAGPCFAQRPLVLLKCMRHSAYPEKVSKDPRQQACAERSPGDRLWSLGSLQPYDPRSWKLTAGSLSMYAQYISWPSSEPLLPQFDYCPGSHVRLEVGADIGRR